MRRIAEVVVVLAAATGMAGCYHDVTLTMDSATSDPVVSLHVENQCLTGQNGVQVCPSSTWAPAAGAVQPACLEASAICPCTSYYTTPLVFDPTQYSDYNNNKSKIHDVTLNSITMVSTPVASTDRATTLSGATVIITDLDATPPQKQTFTLASSVALSGSNTYTASQFTPDPTGFFKGILESGHTFQVDVDTTATIDQCPMDVDVTFAFHVTLSVKLFPP